MRPRGTRGGGLETRTRQIPRLLRLALATLSLLPLTGGRASAHPHVWIDYVVTLMFDKGRVTALREVWSFDEDFSASVLRDYAGIEEGKPLGAPEIAKIEQNAFANLEHYDYFTHVWAAGGAVGVRKATEFAARVDGPRLIYDFVVPLSRPVDARAAPASFGVWDDTYYVDVGPAEGQATKFVGDGSAGCKAAIVEDHDHPIYFGSVYPKTIRVTC